MLRPEVTSRSQRSDRGTGRDLPHRATCHLGGCQSRRQLTLHNRAREHLVSELVQSGRLTQDTRWIYFDWTEPESDTSPVSKPGEEEEAALTD